jgi:hypothetical protein
MQEKGIHYVCKQYQLTKPDPFLRQLSTKDTINGLLVQSAYDVIISKILKETVLFGMAIGSISRTVQKHHYSLETQSKTVYL